MTKRKAEPHPTKIERIAYVDHLQNGMRRGAASRAMGLDRHVFDGYIAEHPEFEAEVLDAETDATEHVEEALWQAAASGNVAAAKAWLDRNDKARPRRPAGDPPERGPVDADLDDDSDVRRLLDRLNR